MEPQQDLLTDLYTVNYEPVSTGKRFANYLIDIVIFYLLAILIVILFGPTVYESGNISSIYIVTYIVFLAYYTILEGATKGKTIGKMITGCRAVKEDGSDITWTDALLRSLSRIVPFEPFSALGGQPWHDRWTKTLVVKKARPVY